MFVPWLQRRCPWCIPVIPRENRISCGISSYSTGFPVEYLDIPQEILSSHMTPTGQKKTIEMIYLQERRGESCESTSPVNYKECASCPYLSYRNLQTSVGLWLPWYKSVIPCLLVVYHEYKAWYNIIHILGNMHFLVLAITLCTVAAVKSIKH